MISGNYWQKFGVEGKTLAKDAKQAAIIGYIPLFGPFGTHDTAVGRKKQSTIHKFLAIPIFFIEFFFFVLFVCDVSCNIPTLIIVGLIADLPVILYFVSYIWAVYECTMIWQIFSNKRVDEKTAKKKAIFASVLAIMIIFALAGLVILYLETRRTSLS